uniref:BZIP domain-containing protein n=1 Tax=Acrobeloides nanus TaxID=290746 RepID=A0A914CQ18_9BILA
MQQSPIRAGCPLVQLDLGWPVGLFVTTFVLLCLGPLREHINPILFVRLDDAYFERRKKNNDAAKRSRDARRQKEEHTAARAQYLEQENIQLHSQIALLKGEIAKLQMLLLTHSTNPSAVMAQLQIKTDSTGHEMSPIEPKSVDSTNHVN